MLEGWASTWKYRKPLPICFYGGLVSRVRQLTVPPTSLQTDHPEKLEETRPGIQIEHEGHQCQQGWLGNTGAHPFSISHFSKRGPE